MHAPVDYCARSFLGVPWRHLGRDRAGMDCIGLLLLAGRMAGHALPDAPAYAREPQDHALRQALAAHLDAVPVSAAAPGDVLLFKLGIYGGHVGICASHPAYGVPSVIHAHLPRRAVVEEVLEPFLPDLTGAYRWRA